MRNLIDLVTESEAPTYTQDELSQYFTSPELYKKTGKVQARRAVPGEMIATVIDGTIETVNTAREDDVVILNPGGEEYILTTEKFEARYTGPTLGYDYASFKATGTTYAVKWTHGDAKFDASWGETMIISNGDMLCSPDETPDGDLYRIERKAFRDTYKKVEPDARDVT
jgi:hypothetical protein